MRLWTRRVLWNENRETLSHHVKSRMKMFCGMLAEASEVPEGVSAVLEGRGVSSFEGFEISSS
jgi:hypothetical protein